MNSDDQRSALRVLEAEIYALVTADVTPTTSSAEFVSWQSRSRSLLARALGADHHITKAFGGIRWDAYGQHLITNEKSPEITWEAAQEATGYLDAAVHEVKALASAQDVFEAASLDPELWEHIASHVAAEAWGTVASQTAIFTEDRIRRWTGQPAGNVGEKLMTTALGDNGDYRLGLTTGEKHGWHRLGMGISMALRNADAHRIQNRRDHRLYAMGVVGVSSLLLTQLRYEHGNRFQDIDPVPLADPTATEATE